MDNKYMKRCSTSLVIRAMKIKTRMRCHFTHTGITVIKKKKKVITKIGPDLENQNPHTLLVRTENSSDR